MNKIKEIATKSFLRGALFAAGLATTSLLAITISGTINTFVSGDILDSAKMNQNFASLKTAVESIDPQYVSQPEAFSPVPTHKRWIDGKPIFRLVVDLGSMPNNTTKNVGHGITGLTNVISITGMITNGTQYRTLPMVTAGAPDTINVTVDASNVSVGTMSSNWITYSGKVILEYTK